MTDALIYNPPGGKVLGSLVLLHGLGASAGDLFPLAGRLCGGQLRVICPQAPTRAITVNGGWQMPAWYDIAGANLEDRQDETGIKDSAELIEQYIVQAENEMESQRIFVGGFSQGAAMALYAGLRHRRQLGGIVALSGYMLLAESLSDDAASENRQTPIFQAHGDFDPVVLPTWAVQCRDTLQTGGWSPVFKQYPIAHNISEDEIDDLDEFLRNTLAE